MARRIMRSFTLGEISAVDRPAQKGARMTIIKRDFSQEERDNLASTGAAMSDGSFPIKSKSDLENAIHDWGRAGSKPSVKDHIISRAKSLGATDLLPDGWVGKRQEVEMTESELAKKVEDAVATATADLKKQLDEANEKLAKAAKPAMPMDAEDAADGADDEEAEKKAKKQAKFDAAVKAEVEKTLAKQATDESFDYDGQTIRKSAVGDGVFAVLKAQSDKIEIAEFTKRVETEFGGLPGEPVAKAKAIRAVAKLGKEDREVLEAMLKSGNAAIAQGMSEIGKGGAQLGDAAAELDKRAEAYAAEHKVNKHIALAKILETKEGSQLYAKSLDEKAKAA